MASFIDNHADKLQGTLSCFDRMLIRGYLPLESGRAMYDFLCAMGIQPNQLKDFLTSQAQRLKQHALEMATKTGRPYVYLSHRMKMHEWARERVLEDGLEQGLVGILSILEPCRTFSLVWRHNRPFIQSARRKCLFLYYYFLDRDLGPDSRAAANLVSLPRAGLSQRPRLARS